jgi:SAM-dependent methyltransferase
MATLAAAYPKARFVGVDLNPEHVRGANALAGRGALANVRFLERDFEDLAREDLPDFDYIAAHGVLSWVGPAKRRAILQLVASRLKPGGLLYVGYNALPAWSAVEPVRRLILDGAAAAPGDNLERARAGVEFAKRVCDAGAAFFKNNPPAREMLATMEKGGLTYVVHEYMHAHWVPMYFTEVAAEMAADDVYFVGQLPLFLNYRDLAIPAAVAPLFKDVTDRITFESLKDFALDQFFRRDVYVKGRAERSDETTRAYLDSTPFSGLLGDGPIDRELRLPHYTLQLTGPLFDALLPALAGEAWTVPALAALPGLTELGIHRIRDAVMRLALGELVAPMLEETPAALPVPEDREALFRVPSAYNRMMLTERLATESPLALASPVAGTGLTISMVQAVAILLLTEVPLAGRPAWIRALLAQRPLRLKVGDRPIVEAAELEQVLLREVDQFRAGRLSKFLALGILERRA